MIERLISHAVRQSPFRWWFRNHLSRIEAIQRSINVLTANTYLEIGVSDGACFAGVSAPRKIGVDPIQMRPAVIEETKRPGVSYFPLTSDEFFEQEAPRILCEGVDVVFIDGLHAFEQAYRDCLTALTYLNPGGIILVHDCLPSSMAEAVPVSSYEEAEKLNGAGSNWTGDVWKAIAMLRALHLDLETVVLDCDHGLGLVSHGHSVGLSLSAQQIRSMTYDDLTCDAERLLGLRSPRHLLAVLQRLKTQRQSFANSGLTARENGRVPLNG